VRPARNAGGGKLCQLLQRWIEIKTPGWVDLTIWGQTSCARVVADDPIGNMSVASIGVSDAGGWPGCARPAWGRGRSEPRPDRLVVVAVSGAGRHRPALASARPPPLGQGVMTADPGAFRAPLPSCPAVWPAASTQRRAITNRAARRGQAFGWRGVRWCHCRASCDDCMVVEEIVVASDAAEFRFAGEIADEERGSRG
jgi:hypothetical protein